MAAGGGGHVVVDGSGALATDTVHQLLRTGVRVRSGALAADAELTAGPAGPLPALVVLVSDRSVPAWAGAVWQSRGVAHLPVRSGDGTTVGPLVLPGRSPCLLCVARRHPTGARPVVPRDDPAGRVLAAAVVTVTVLAVLRGDEALAGISTDIGPGVETVTHRLWHAEPGCRCASVRMCG